MYITEYWTINKTAKIAVRAVWMYREKRDLSEKREGKVLAIYTVHRMFPKIPQRKNIWKRIWSGGETQYLHVEIVRYFVGKDQVRHVGETDRVFGYQVRLFRKCLRDGQKYRFDRFYYEK